MTAIVAGTTSVSQKTSAPQSRWIIRLVLAPVAIVTSSAPVVKALAMMEQYNSSYAFVIDDDQYRGIVTRMGIARLMLQVQER